MPLSRRLLAVGIVTSSIALSGCAQHGGASALPAVSGGSAERDGAAAVALATVWTQSDAVKILPDDRPVARNTSIVAGGAMGESVSYQLVVSAMRGKTIRGNKVSIRIDRKK